MKSNRLSVLRTAGLCVCAAVCVVMLASCGGKGKDAAKAGKVSSRSKEGKAKGGARRKRVSVTKAENLACKLSEDNGSVVVMGLNGVEKDDVVKIVIPATVEGIPVTKISDSAFSGCDSLTSVTLPDSVKEIGGGVFASCQYLKTVKLPSAVTKIGDGAFSGCHALEAIVLPDSITELGGDVFDWCESLKSVKLPASMEEIPKGMFEGCKLLKSIDIPDTVKKIYWDAFKGCTALVSANLPSSLEYMGSGAFQNCTALKNLTIPDGLSLSVDSNNYDADGWRVAFSGCTSLPLKTQAVLKKLGFAGFN